MKKIILSLIIAIGCLPITFSQFGEEENNTMNHAAGLHAGGISGSGFSYRYLPSKGYGVQVTGIPILRESGDFYGNAGLSLLYSFKTFNRVNLYGFLGNSIDYSSSTYMYSDFNDETGKIEEITRKETDRDYSVGIGAGVNIRRWDVIDFTFAGGYAFKNHKRVNEFGTEKTISANVAIEIGIYYRF